jgi:hypothetical protein
MKVLKLYAWEKHFKNVVEGLGKKNLSGYSQFYHRGGTI